MRTALIVVATAALTSVLMPLGVQAAGTLMTIVDDDTSSKAQVTGGRLQVGDGSGALTVNGSVGMAGTPFKRVLSDNVEAGDFSFQTTSYVVPAGKFLTITRVSGTILVAPSELVQLARLVDSQDAAAGPEVASTHHILAPAHTVATSDLRNYVFADDVLIPVPAGKSITVTASRGGSAAGSASLHFYVAGYLTNA